MQVLSSLLVILPLLGANVLAHPVIELGQSPTIHSIKLNRELSTIYERSLQHEEKRGLVSSATKLLNKVIAKVTNSSKEAAAREARFDRVVAAHRAMGRPIEDERMAAETRRKDVEAEIKAADTEVKAPSLQPTSS